MSEAPAWTEGLNLPQSVLDLAEYSPAEDIILAVLRDKMPDIPTFALIPDDPPSMFVLVRKDHSPGIQRGHPRFLAYARFRVDVFTEDPNGDEKGAVVSEAIRVILRDAWLSNYHIPGRGWITQVELKSEGSRKTDWATASGPVQYADLPNGYWRYESKYELYFRPQSTT